jgi:hypothetical protein
VKRQPTLEGVPEKPRKRWQLKQPRKAWLRARIDTLERENAELRAELEDQRAPLWRRLLNRRTP